MNIKDFEKEATEEMDYNFNLHSLSFETTELDECFDDLSPLEDGFVEANRPETYIYKCSYCKNMLDVRWDDTKCSICYGPFKGFANRMPTQELPGNVEVVAHIEEADIKGIVDEYLREVNLSFHYVEFDALWVVTSCCSQEESEEIIITLYFKLVEGKVRYFLEFRRTSSGCGGLYGTIYNELIYRLT